MFSWKVSESLTYLLVYLVSKQRNIISNAFIRLSSKMLWIWGGRVRWSSCEGLGWEETVNLECYLCNLFFVFYFPHFQGVCFLEKIFFINSAGQLLVKLYQTKRLTEVRVGNL